ncbi:MAG TPA: methylated-DNA--[protein]-cysteine S-methyltransferase [Gammaproteobacteria bacterium]|nr:methylated-DNA--[protein]-cysteine S-methyltransferase [Gammaproteobacteria bacterium]
MTVCDSTDAYAAVVGSPVGRLGIVVRGQDLAAIDLLAGAGPLQPPRQAAARAVASQLRAYFDNPGAAFTLSLAPRGSAYQQRVWQALCAIPPGRPVTYGALARRLQTSPRAVGQACRRNPIPIVIPCHRVVAATGAGGYAGRTGGPELAVKRWLLAHEAGGTP